MNDETYDHGSDAGRTVLGGLLNVTAAAAAGEPRLVEVEEATRAILS